jgi:hypothetical protein
VRALRGGDKSRGAGTPRRLWSIATKRRTERRLLSAAILAALAGAPSFHPGNSPPALAVNEVKNMQAMLKRAGYDVGAIDGFMGLKTRQAVKAMQQKYGLPADSYPTAELLARMRAAR